MSKVRRVSYRIFCNPFVFFLIGIFISQVKVLYVRNLKSDFNEEKIKELFEPFGPILRIKKLKDYAFVHFEERDHAVKVRY